MLGILLFGKAGYVLIADTTSGIGLQGPLQVITDKGLIDGGLLQESV